MSDKFGDAFRFTSMPGEQAYLAVDAQGYKIYFYIGSKAGHQPETLNECREALMAEAGRLGVDLSGYRCQIGGALEFRDDTQGLQFSRGVGINGIAAIKARQGSMAALVKLCSLGDPEISADSLNDLAGLASEALHSIGFQPESISTAFWNN